MAGGSKLGGHGRDRVLVLERDREAAAVADTVLRELGYAVEIARQGLEALSTLSRVAPKLIVLDVTPPLKRAVEFLEGVRRLRDVRGVPVIATFSGARPPDSSCDELRELGVGQFLAKPLQQNALVAAVNKATGRALAPFESQVRPRWQSPASRPGAARPPRGSPTGRVPGERTGDDFSPPKSRPGRPRPEPQRPGQDDSTFTEATMTQVAAVMQVGSDVVPCIVEQADASELTLRCESRAPDRGERVEVTARLGAVLDNRPLQIAVEIVGEVLAIRESGSERRVRVAVRAVRPEQDFEQLIEYLARFT